MQHTGLPGGDTARRTGHRETLFCRQVPLPHFDTVRQNRPQSCSILNASEPTRHLLVTGGWVPLSSPKTPPGGASFLRFQQNGSGILADSTRASYCTLPTNFHFHFSNPRP